MAFCDGQKSCAFLSQIRRSSNILSSFLVKTFSWMQVSPQVSYEKKQSSWETEKSYKSATLTWTFCLLGQLNIRERGVQTRREEEKRKGKEGKDTCKYWDWPDIHLTLYFHKEIVRNFRKKGMWRNAKNCRQSIQCIPAKARGTGTYQRFSLLQTNRSVST